MADNSFQFDDIETPVLEETAPAVEMPERNQIIEISNMFKLLSDSTRLKILYAIKSQELSVQEIADTVETSQSAVSHQLRLLRNTGVVDFKKNGRSTFYFISSEVIIELLEKGLNL